MAGVRSTVLSLPPRRLSDERELAGGRLKTVNQTPMHLSPEGADGAGLCVDAEAAETDVLAAIAGAERPVRAAPAMAEDRHAFAADRLRRDEVPPQRVGRLRVRSHWAGRLWCRRGSRGRRLRRLARNVSFAHHPPRRAAHEDQPDHEHRQTRPPRLRRTLGLDASREHTTLRTRAGVPRQCGLAVLAAGHGAISIALWGQVYSFQSSADKTFAWRGACCGRLETVDLTPKPSGLALM
jgi:hypothetical protein